MGGLGTGMSTEVLNLSDAGSYRANIEKAARRLADGGLVAFPTETVYGLGASVFNMNTIERLRTVKGRAESKPFTLHIAKPGDVAAYVPELSRVGRRLTRKGWPGPLTIIFEVEGLDRAPILDRLAGRDADVLYHGHTIGVRCPDDRDAAALLEAAGVPVVAPSANLAGQAPPVTAADVLEDLDGQIDIVLDGGRTRYGKPSTIVRVNGDRYEVVREGVLAERTIRRLATETFLFVCTGNTCRSPMAAALGTKLLAEKVGCAMEALADKGFSVVSAGAFCGSGAPVSEGAVRAMRNRGLEIGDHRSRSLSVELVRSADHVFAMTEMHRSAVLALAPEAGEKTRLLDESGNIDDPLGGDDTVYEACAARIAEALGRRLSEMPV
jgi:L-threonylcarbamoyladenylate synthase